MPKSTYRDWLDQVKAKGDIVVTGATKEEMGVIRAALNLYRTRCDEKHVDNPHMGWKNSAITAEEITIRLTP